MKRGFSLEGRLTGLLMLAALAGAWLGMMLLTPERSPVYVLLGVFGLLLLPVLWLARRTVSPLRRLLRALEGAVASYRDGDFSFSLREIRDDDLGRLATLHNELGKALREQRQTLAQRELLLDTITQHSPVALLLVDTHDRIVFSNLAARQLLNDSRSLEGDALAALLERAPQPLRDAMAASGDSLFSVELEGSEEYFHLAKRQFSIRGRKHALYLLKRLTRELSRQEVAVWKKLIRVLSHELNNSLAPIISLAHSGERLVERGDLSALPTVFSGIGERAKHLHEFVSGYASFARLPAPRLAPVSWAEMIGELQQQYAFSVVGGLPASPGVFDRAQVEQALINLLKNAHESNGPASAVELSVTQSAGQQQIQVRDGGAGMAEAVLLQATLPFYSTKRTGSGLGLALVREIAEAHGGQLRIANRAEGGLAVTLILPAG